jgi:hypothetical protein
MIALNGTWCRTQSSKDSCATRQPNRTQQQLAKHNQNQNKDAGLREGLRLYEPVIVRHDRCAFKVVHDLPPFRTLLGILERLINCQALMTTYFHTGLQGRERRRKDGLPGVFSTLLHTTLCHSKTMRSRRGMHVLEMQRGTVGSELG